MNIQELKRKIMVANRHYRDGNPIINDEFFDALLDQLQNEIPEEDYKIFSKTLMEAPGKIELPYRLGSLQKCVYKTNQLQKWAEKYKYDELFVSDKIDGMSFCAGYKNGMLQAAYTRGDGYFGEDITEKMLIIQPTSNHLEIGDSDTIWTRGELLLDEKECTRIGYANRRNGTVGIVKSDTYEVESIKCVKAYFHGILGTDLSISDQFMLLEEMFGKSKVPKSYIVECNEEKLVKIVNNQNNEYIADGLVISSVDYITENIYYPEHAKAFKVNKEGIETTVKGIEWRVSKSGLLKPIVLIEPKQISGTTVKRVSGFNYQYCKDNFINVGAIVKVIKAGEIIPSIVEIVHPGELGFGKIICPSCGSKVERFGVDLKCTSNDCKVTSYKSIMTFLSRCKVDGISWVGLKNLEIDSFDKLINFKARENSKTETNFQNELLEKVFQKSEEELFVRFNYNGVGKRTFEKILQVYNLLDFIEELKAENLTKKVHGISINRIYELSPIILENFETLNKIIKDERWNPLTIERKSVNINQNIKDKSFCITGVLSKGRKEVEKLITENDGIISGVNSKLDYLICGEKPGSKLKKAESLNITILEESDFMNLI